MIHLLPIVWVGKTVEQFGFEFQPTLDRHREFLERTQHQKRDWDADDKRQTKHGCGHVLLTDRKNGIKAA